MIGLAVKKWHLLTWNPAKWSMDWDADVASGNVDGQWTTGVHKTSISIGDGLFFLMQGTGPRGILAVGTATSEIWQEPHWNGIKGAEANYVDAEWIEYRSIDDRLPTGVLKKEVPGVPWKNIFGSGWEVPDPSAARILELWNDVPGSVAVVHGKKTNRKVKDSAGYIADATRKTVIEEYAEAMVKTHLEDHGYSVDLVGKRESWDITAVRDTVELHVEVKGSTGTRSKVVLTKNEVKHSRSYGTVALAVVDQIAMTASNQVSGGRLRVWTNWSARDSRLTATGYDYSLPARSAADFE